MSSYIKREFFQWLDELLDQEFPEETSALFFNLVEFNDDCWAVELICTEDFDPSDDSWTGSEVAAFRDDPFEFDYECDYERAQTTVAGILEAYLEDGASANILKHYDAVAVGSPDEDIQTVFEC